MSIITISLSQPQSFDSGALTGNWITDILGSGGYTIGSITADQVVLNVTAAPWAGDTVLLNSAGQFVATAGGQSPFTGGIAEAVLLDKDGGTIGIISGLQTTGSISNLGGGSLVAAYGAEFDGSAGNDTIVGSVHTDIIKGGDGDDSLSGGLGLAGDSMAGGAGADTMVGSAGDDTIQGGNGGDHIDGGAGDDLVLLNESPGFVEAWLDQATPPGQIRVDNAELVAVGDGGSHLHGGARDDFLFGGAGADQFEGAGGNDLLYGLDGADTLTGGPGDDYLNGGAGDDYLDGGAGEDDADYFDSPVGVTVDLHLTTAQQTGFGKDTLINIEDLEGSFHNDTLTGDEGPNVIFAYQGDDVVNGAGGDDFLSGSLGDDTLHGGGGADTIADSSGSNYLRGEDGDDVISGGSGFDDANGNIGNDNHPRERRERLFGGRQGR